MNICEALKEAREQGRAIRQPTWPEGIYAYHGDANLLRFSNNSHEISFAVATLLADDFELADAPYHGPLEVEV